MATLFVLGAGFSVDENFPLVRGLTGRVIHFLEAEQHPSYGTFLQPGNGGHPQGQFYVGLESVNGGRQLGFEELMLGLQEHLAHAASTDPAYVTRHLLRVGCARLLWCIQNSTSWIGPHYVRFARAVAAEHGAVVSFNWDLLAERAFENAAIPWSYTNAAEAVPILKPHGSLNWFGFLRQGLKPEYPGWVPIGAGRQLTYIRESPFENPDAHETNPDLRYDYMVFPGSPELPDDPDLKLIWADIQARAEASDKIAFIGYSLPAYDSWSCQFFARACTGKIVEVYNPSPEALDRFRQVIGDFTSRHEQTFSQSRYSQA